MKLNIDLKTLLTLGGIVAMLSGFVYTTTLRLDLVDQRIERLEADCDSLRRQLRPKKGNKRNEKKQKAN